MAYPSFARPRPYAGLKAPFMTASGLLAQVQAGAEAFTEDRTKSRQMHKHCAEAPQREAIVHFRHPAP